MKNLIIVGGFFHVAFAVFHVFFWKLFDWKKDLGSLTSLNRNVMQILNLSLTFVFIIFAYVSIFNADELLAGGLGSTLLAAIAISWLLRAGYQILFFGLRSKLSMGFFVVFLLGAFIYAFPLIR